MYRNVIVAVSLVAMGSAAWADPEVNVSGAAPEPVSVGYQVETSVASTYIFRGLPQYGHQTDPSSQNTLALRLDHLGPGSLMMSVWNATALRGFGEQPGNALEFDITAGYSARVHGDIDLGIGYIAYVYPEHLAGTPVDGAHEVFGAIAYANDYLVPSLTVFGEFIRQQGAYVALGLAHDFAWKILTVTPAANLGLAGYRHYLGSDQSANLHVNDLTASLQAKLSFPRDFYITARVAWSLRGTPAELLVPGTEGYGFDGRSSMYGALALGFTR